MGEPNVERRADETVWKLSLFVALLLRFYEQTGVGLLNTTCTPGCVRVALAMVSMSGL
jgi:hypothetical protein